MAYGRLEVYWPDGRLETHFLDTETVSIGRAEGNTIALDTDAISRYHMSITKDGDNITLTDLGSQNGTYADGVRLESNKPHLLGDVEEIQVGSLRILFRKVDESPTMAIPQIRPRIFRGCGASTAHCPTDEGRFFLAMGRQRI